MMTIVASTIGSRRSSRRLGSFVIVIVGSTVTLDGWCHIEE